MDDILKGLQQPEYLHAILNHLPVVGLLAGLVVLVIALFQRNRGTAIAAYVVIFVAALSIYPVSGLGEKAENGMQSVVDPDGAAWLREHEQRAEKTTPVYYITAALALAGIVLPLKTSKIIATLAVVTLLCGILALGAGIWIAAAGGKIRHREFRYAPPPTARADG